MSRGANKELEKTRKEPLWGAGKRQWQSRNKFKFYLQKVGVSLPDHKREVKQN